ncbi:class II aldolase/adducin family protein [Blastococcus sp. CT_GayMR16]|uniref:class II aldolase/adducin family protein n=1 Tax=Blastococcus sp. CT_GayMR16 TaxID=2559607 RepID=UPI0014312D68|nr:class II aldolase/adducin family protein [Blastococcus sp. CT_GayMR16]
MHSSEPSVPAGLEDLLDLSVRLGSDLRLVQGAGGNLSIKTDGVLWIKASGTRLSQARTRDIFVPMDEAATREAVLVTEALTPYVLPSAQAGGLRPSIETALHVLLPHTVVVHVHGVGSIAAGLTDGVEESVRTLPADVDTVVVPYAKPGVELARAVLARTPADLTGDRPLVLVLRNHGVVVGAADSATAAEVLDRVEAHFRSASAPPADVSTDSGPLSPPGTVDATAAAVLCAGALTPDSAVFLGPAPFGRIDGGPPAADDGSPHSGFVADDGSVWLRPGLGPDEREVAASLVDAARQTDGGDVSTLSTAQVDELVTWEAEKWRQQLKR